MTLEEVQQIADKLDEDMRKKISEEVKERLDILQEAELDEEEIDKIEECLYISLIVQEYLDGEYEILEEERNFLLDEMEELYNEYGELLTKARLEEKVNKKKRMTLELMQIRQELLRSKEIMAGVKERIVQNRESKEKMNNSSSKELMKKILEEEKLLKEVKKQDNPAQDKIEIKSTMATQAIKPMDVVTEQKFKTIKEKYTADVINITHNYEGKSSESDAALDLVAAYEARR